MCKSEKYALLTGKLQKKLKFLFLVYLLLACLAFSEVCDAEVLRETVPLERNNIQLHLERYYEADGKEKEPVLFVHGLTYSSHEFDVDYSEKIQLGKRCAGL